MDKSAFMVDANLRAIRLADIRKVRDRLRAQQTVPSKPSPGPELAVLNGDQKLEPGKVYLGSNGAKSQFYLPEYQVADNNGVPAVELRFSGENDDEDGEVGRLTIDFTWVAATGQSQSTPRVIEHVTDLELRYRLPIEGSASAGAREVVALQPLQVTGDTSAQSITVFSDKLQFDAVYQAMRDADRQPTLYLSYEAHVGVQTWKQVRVGTATDTLIQAAALRRRSALVTNVLSRETLASLKQSSTQGGTARVTVKQDQEAEAARVRAMRAALARQTAFTRPGRTITARPVPVRVKESTAADEVRRKALEARRHAAELDAAKRRASVNPATDRARVVVNPVMARLVAPAIRRAVIAPSARVAVKPATPTVRVRPVEPKPTVRVTPGARVRVAPATVAAKPVGIRTVSTRGRIAVASRSGAMAKPVISAETLTRVNAPALAKAVASSDLRFKNQKVVPLQLALNRKGEPAIVDAELECSAELPFFFDPRTKSSVYATESFQTGGIHLLLPRTLTDETGRTNRVVYQDNLMPEVIHVAPTEYRLARSQDAPFLPGISMLCADFGTTADGQDQADVIFNVVCSYELEPWLDPEIVELARTELAAEGLTARFTPIVPREANLTLELDLLGDERLRGEAEIEASVGIADTMILNHDAFTRFWREHLANETGGITGKVTYELFDGTPAQSRVSLSLWETSPDVFDVDFVGMLEDEPGRCRIRIRNRIESPAAIVNLPPERISAEAVAVPVNGGALSGRLLQPQESIEVDYQVTPPDAVVEALDPVIFGRVQPNLNALLKLFVLNSGYSSMSFSLDVAAAEGAFTPPAEGAEPLTGLLVEFDDGSKAHLSPDEPATEVTLVGRLIDQLMGTAGEQQRYFYRVTNLHPSGEGARTGWKEGQGSDPIEVGTAIVQLDF